MRMSASELHYAGVLARLKAGKSYRWAFIGACIFLIELSHYRTPIEPRSLHSIHVLMQLLFVLPALLAAAWYGLRGALITVGLITALYIPHIMFQWAAYPEENVNQYAQLATIWFTAVVAGAFMDREKNALHRLDRTHEGALIALVSALDAREHNTQLHSLRVRAYAVRLGRAIGITQRDLAILSEGALLHDIGKIGVPDAILLKEGPLGPEEWDQVRRHCDTGRRILGSVPFLSDAIKVVWAHHEKYDGTGYPRGQAGHEIPLVARIFAVADAFDALTSNRPYQKAVSLDEAKRQIQAGSGTHFDPEVVRAFLTVPDEEWQRIACGVSPNPGLPGAQS